MNLPTLATDNITEMLLKIIEFTHTRQKILIQNIHSMHACDFVPKDVPMDEFSKLMHNTVNEYAGSKQLVFCDSSNVKFGANGNFKAMAIIDEQAKQLLEESRDEYLRGQIMKLLENSLNQRIAMELLRQKQSGELRLGRCLN